MTIDSGRQAGGTNERTKAALRDAEELIAKWDQEGGLTYRQLARRLGEILGRAEAL
jgi:hypothetical protein